MTMIDDQDGWTAKLNLYYSPPNTHIYNNMYTHTVNTCLNYWMDIQDCVCECVVVGAGWYTILNKC